jgi:hypothetical protein
VNDSRHTPIAQTVKRRIQRILRETMPFPVPPEDGETHENDWNISDCDDSDEDQEETIPVHSEHIENTL